MSGEETVYDLLIKRLKNNRIVAIILIFFAIIVGVGTILSSIKEISIYIPKTDSTKIQQINKPQNIEPIESSNANKDKFFKDSYDVENSIESFIEDPNISVDKTTWFTLTKTKFNTKNKKLVIESFDDIKYLSEILKKYSNVDTKIGGYTDNLNDEMISLKISNNIAKTVKDALIETGINSNRLEYEGYGSNFPIASNDSEVGRNQNNRIDIRVIKK